MRQILFYLEPPMQIYEGIPRLKKYIAVTFGMAVTVMKDNVEL